MADPETMSYNHARGGVCILPEVWKDEFVIIQSRYKRGIYAPDTVLFLCDLTDRTPAKSHMVFPSTYSLSNPKRDGIVNLFWMTANKGFYIMDCQSSLVRIFTSSSSVVSACVLQTPNA